MNYSAIRTALEGVGLNWTLAAEAIGCSPHHLMNVCARRAESQPAAKALAALIGKEVSDVFPDIPRYQEDRKADRANRLAEAKARLAEAGVRVA